MSKKYRLGVALASAVLVVLVADSRPIFGQRITIGGNQSNRDRDEDNDAENADIDDEQNRGNRSSRQRTEDQVRRLLQGQNAQRGQSGQRGNLGQYQYQQFRPQQSGQTDLRFGGWQNDRWQGSRDVERWANIFGGGQRPFSEEWHRDHPRAWRHEHHDHDDVWVVATLPGIYTWLGWGNAPVQPGVRIGPPPDLSQFHDFYPLGVYSLMSGPGDMGTRIVQLAIDRHGHIAGNYYDMITDTNSSVSGEVRRDSQRVYWSVNKNKSIRFRVRLDRLVQPYGTMTVQLPGGEQDWQFVRLEN
jgi:hypothetical protein